VAFAWSDFVLQIGTGNWLRTLKSITEPLGSDFWSGFIPATESELRSAEKQLGRTLDAEFREFYRTVGYGNFPYYGDFCAPEEFIRGAGPAIYFLTGSLSPGDQWATEEEHARLWLSRGRDNPNPKRFTEDVLTFDGVKLYDLLQFGSNGCCCYHQLFVGPEPTSLRYCLLTDSGTMEDRSVTFSEAICRILQFQLQDLESD
jgi:hypothetical protein